ncbi:hypothetical protein I79_004406 [Cricetulus griseus]|uniref:Uncharacterized protein n=1 Tax=Cricetulus griseus TaxID=10029 RepID=G3H2J3_CRIGR|nr:hypothetical protein I79_004406 [Cricetulus griseus]
MARNGNFSSLSQFYRPLVPTFYLPCIFKLKKEQRPEAVWTEAAPCFCTGNAGHQLAKDSLSWINWKSKQQSTGFSSLPEWGRGSQVVPCANDKLLPSAGHLN